ncbi:MAG: acyl-CoA dehydrogenase [Rhodospirillales bacterium]|nr:acyl-CoA dehydrogenase [Rhodospirillales bacterium]MBO6786255.1 acyl-CoA dehydrogenase [Rhodospirillales bacterium]
MTAYHAPVEEMLFVMSEIGELESLGKLPGYEDATPDLVSAILDEAGKLATDVLDPINVSGDLEGCTLENGVVRTPAGFKEAYAQFIEAGWNSMPFDPEYGGQGLPWLVATGASEIWHGANMAFGLCPMLTGGAVELLSIHASQEIKDTYLEKMISGEWTGTMNLTEPQAGSDLARVRTKAVKEGDKYLISGQKIFITYGEQDFTENIVHLVLARTPDAPEGIKGISLFVVPKFIPNSDGSLGERNDLRCGSLEHKLGINASPTAVMLFGENDGAVGYLVGEENRGIEYMFTMMNNARLAVGLEGVAIAERAYQRARAFAEERVQGRDSAGSSKEPVAIIQHPDVRRMLLSMRAQTEAVRALAYWVAARLDIAHRHTNPATAKTAQAYVDLLTPVVKAWSTDIGVEVANTGIQVHGGMGFIEETGAAQHLRDARIAPIYEGTNGIQAIDLAGRKVAREGGETMMTLIAEMRSSIAAMGHAHERLSKAADELERTTKWISDTYAENPVTALAGAVPYLRLTGITVGGWLMVRMYEAANAKADENPLATQRRRASVSFYARHVLTQAGGLAESVMDGSSVIADTPPEAV